MDELERLREENRRLKKQLENLEPWYGTGQPCPPQISDGAWSSDYGGLDAWGRKL